MRKVNPTQYLAMVIAVFAVTEIAMAVGPFPVATLSGTDDTRVGIGLRFEFGDNTAQVVGSVRHTYTNTDNNVTGALAELAVPIFPNTNFAPKARAMGLIGNTTVQGELGIGFDFANQQPLIGAGIHGPYVEAGANYLFDGQFHPYIGVDSYGGAPGATVVPPALN